MRRPISYCVLGILLTATSVAADSPTFRGPGRDGIFREKGLLQSWPDAGPKQLWSVDGLGDGYASVAVADGRLYTTGKHGDRAFVFAFDLEGRELWRKDVGEAHAGGGYPGTRTTPTVDDGRLYLLTSVGHAVALDAADGDELWRVDLLETFGGENLYFGISESPLVDGERVIYTPGGEDASVVALDKTTGETVWTSKGLSDGAAYCNPRVVEHGGRRQIVTHVRKHLAGLDPASGEVLWRVPLTARYDIHAVSPLSWRDLVFTSHGYGQGTKAFRLAEDGRKATEVWTSKALDVHHGGAVVLDGRLYGAASKRSWHVLDAATGESLASIPRLGKGAVVYADGRLYGYLENGKVVLVNPDPARFEVVGSFEIEAGDGQHWAHPVIAGGVLYVRHGSVLMAFDVRAGKPHP